METESGVAMSGMGEEGGFVFVGVACPLWGEEEDLGMGAMMAAQPRECAQCYRTKHLKNS